MGKAGPGAGWTVLVTGASSGLGRCLAHELARKHCRLVLSGRNRQRLEIVAEEVRLAGAPSADVICADLAVPGGPEGLLSAVEALGYPLDALVNSAGAGRAGPWITGGNDEDKGLVKLLVEAPLVLTRGLLPGWKSRGKGAVLNVASTGAFHPGPQTAVYYASKAFLASWSLALAREERRWLVVTTLCPGALKTGFSAAAGKNDVPGAPGPEKTARKAVRAWEKNRGLVVPGLFNKLVVFVSRLAPPSWSAGWVEAVQLTVRKR